MSRTLFTVWGEPALKMLRYQQQFPFFDKVKLNLSVRFINLFDVLVDGKYESALARIEEQVQKYSPSMVFIDSFRSLVVAGASPESDTVTRRQQQFVQQLAQIMAGWQATTFLIGEYLLPESDLTPVFTVADGIIVLSQRVLRNAMVRKMQVLKLRGQAQTPGLHTFRIDDGGIQVFPRAILGPGSTGGEAGGETKPTIRLTMGNPIFDEILGGGLPEGYSLLVIGPPGAGKTIIATQFLAAGAQCGEPGVLAAFEKSPSQLLSSKLAVAVPAEMRANMKRQNAMLCFTLH